MNIKIGPDSTSQSEEQVVSQCPVYKPQLQQELVFMQYDGVLWNKDIKVNGIGKTLKYICKRWHRSEGEMGKNILWKQYRMFPVNLIRSIVHVFPADMEITKISMYVSRRRECETLRCSEDGWESIIYYFNRFYRPRVRSTRTRMRLFSD